MTLGRVSERDFHYDTGASWKHARLLLWQQGWALLSQDMPGGHVKVEAPGSDGFSWFAVHAPWDAAAPTHLLANNRFVCASTEDVLVPGSHHWCWFKHDSNTWEPFQGT